MCNLSQIDGRIITGQCDAGQWAIDVLDQSNAGANPVLDHVKNMVLDQGGNKEQDLGANMKLVHVANKVRVELAHEV